MVVTGSSSGVGHALAELLVSRGHSVIGIDRVVPEREVPWRHVHGDLTLGLGDSIPRIELSGLALVAGVASSETPLTTWRTNYLAQRGLFESIRDRLNPGSAVVVVSSVSASQRPLTDAELGELTDPVATPPDLGDLLGDRELSPGDEYRLSKLALRQWALALSSAVRDNLIRVNVVSPGPIDTNALEDYAAVVGAKSVERARRMLGRHAAPSEVAGAIAFLLSSDASWVNGVDLRVDGGLMAALGAKR